MDTILVVCGAGASSTFLASRIRSLADARQVDVTARAISEADLAARVADVNVLLVGPHLANRFAEFEALAAEYGVPAALLPETAFGPTGADQALALALPLLTERHSLG